MAHNVVKTKIARKKKRTSKHVLQAQELARARSQPPSDSGPTKQQRNKQARTNHIKDPSEAAAYLSAWKYRDEEAGAWKFNKNTQSWLIRHMYQADRVVKTDFVLLVDYLRGLAQGSTRTRVLDDATRRALRYKEYEKTTSADEKKSDDQEEEEEEDKNDDDVKQSPSSEDGRHVEENDEEKWKRMNDHDKRKEYKRARKVIEALRD